MKIVHALKTLIRQNFKKQNIGTTVIEVIAVIIWMGSTLIFYLVISDIFSDFHLFTKSYVITIVATYFVSDGLIFSLLYRNVGHLSNDIETRKLEHFLLLPTNMIKHISFRNIQFASMIQVPIALVMLFLWGNFSLTAFLMWTISIILGLYIAYNIWLIIIASSFWVKTNGHASIMYEELLQMGLFPLNIYLSFKLFWPLLPIALITSGGALVLSDNKYWILVVQGILLIIVILLRKFIWGLGVKRYRWN